MSDQTYADLEKALRAHIADITNGKMLTNWVLIGASVGADPHKTTYRWVHDDATNAHVLIGLSIMLADEMRNCRFEPLDEAGE